MIAPVIVVLHKAPQGAFQFPWAPCQGEGTGPGGAGSEKAERFSRGGAAVSGSGEASGWSPRRCAKNALGETAGEVLGYGDCMVAEVRRGSCEGSRAGGRPSIGGWRGLERGPAAPGATRSDGGMVMRSGSEAHATPAVPWRDCGAGGRTRGESVTRYPSLAS